MRLNHLQQEQLIRRDLTMSRNTCVDRPPQLIGGPDQTPIYWVAET